MVKPTPLEDFYARFAPVADAEPGILPPPGQPGEAGHFNVFNVADLVPGLRHQPLAAFDRRAYYKISLVRGRGQVEYADQVLDIGPTALWFATTHVPYRWVPHDLHQAGYFCLFTDEFLRPAGGRLLLDELPVFQAGGHPVLAVTAAEYAAAAAIFQKMAKEINSAYAYKYDLLRAYLLELMHLGQKLHPAPALATTPNAAARVAALFSELLERQFPLETPQQRLRLRTPKDYADRLAVHVNHLNRVLKETTGHTTTALISRRVAQEAKILLWQTNWNISEIADGLGFANVAHFCTFFKRQTAQVPGAFRAASV